MAPKGRGELGALCNAAARNDFDPLLLGDRARDPLQDDVLEVEICDSVLSLEVVCVVGFRGGVVVVRSLASSLCRAVTGVCVCVGRSGIDLPLPPLEQQPLHPLDNAHTLSHILTNCFKKPQRIHTRRGPAGSSSRKHHHQLPANEPTHLAPLCYRGALGLRASPPAEREACVRHHTRRRPSAAPASAQRVRTRRPRLRRGVPPLSVPSFKATLA